MADMKTIFNDIPHLQLLIGCVAVILLATSGIAAVRAWMPGSTETEDVAFGGDKPPVPAAGLVDSTARSSSGSTDGDARIRSKCAECAVVESAREIDAPAKASDAAGWMARAGRNETSEKPARSYEVTVRIRDGSNRVFMHKTTANWHAGERLIFIAGASQANN